jgi:hypothetical protein
VLHFSTYHSLNMKHLLTFFLTILSIYIGAAQGGFAFGFKGGPSAGFQRWNNYDRDPLYKYHGAAFVESLSEEGPYSVFAQLGYHVKGSAIRFQRTVIQTQTGFQSVPGGRIGFQFNNVSLLLGGKQKKSFNESNLSYYYQFGVRGDYTINTNLLSGQDPSASYYYPIYPIKENVQKFNYGATIGGGIEFPFSELIGGMIELNIHPDFSNQYFSPPIQNLRDPYTGQSYSSGEQRVFNIVAELSLGIRLINKVIYDEK